MKLKFSFAFALLCTVAYLSIGAVPASAQQSQGKPPMYTYVSFWNISRAQWADMAKSDAADKPILDKALADGTLVGAGTDRALVHSVDGATHDAWWSSNSLAGLMNVLDRFYQDPNTTSPVLNGSLKHWDDIYVSHHYNYKPGSFTGAYTYAAMYRLRDSAPDDAVDQIANDLVVPLLEKLLANGTIIEYEIDTQAIHSDAPGAFWIVFVCPKADGLDKFNAALSEGRMANPLGIAAFGSMVDYSQHRDYLARTNGTYK